MDLQHPDSITAMIELSVEDSLESLLLEENTYFTFQVSVEDVMLYETRVLLDSNLILSSQMYTGGFYINPNLMADGLHNLRLELSTSAGSGSLADKLGAEGYIAYGEWPLFTMGDEPLSLPSITSTYPDNGMLRINWTRSQRFKFENYKLKAFGTLYTTGSVADTSFLDPYFIGGEIDYRPIVTIAGEEFEGTTYTTSQPLPNIHSAEKLGTNAILLKWSPCAYPANFGSYSVQIPYADPVVKRDINDTSYVWDNVPFGKAMDCWLYTANKSEASAYHGTGHSIPLFIGDSTGLKFDQVGYNPQSDRLVYSLGNTLKSADGSSLEILNSTVINSQLHCVISPGANMIVGYNNEVITTFDATSLEQGTSLNPGHLLEGDLNIYNLVLSETGLALFLTRISNEVSDDYIVAIDLNSQQVVDSMIFPANVYYPPVMRCSANGEYVVFNYTMMRLNNGSFSSLHQGDYASYIMFAADEQRVFVSTPTRIKVLELPSLSELSSVSSPTRAILSLDMEAGYLGAHYTASHRFIAFNLNDLSLAADFPVAEADYILFNNHILSSAGYRKAVID